MDTSWESNRCSMDTLVPVQRSKETRGQRDRRFTPVIKWSQDASIRLIKCTPWIFSRSVPHSWVIFRSSSRVVRTNLTESDILLRTTLGHWMFYCEPESEAPSCLIVGRSSLGGSLRDRIFLRGQCRRQNRVSEGQTRKSRWPDTWGVHVSDVIIVGRTVLGLVWDPWELSMLVSIDNWVQQKGFQNTPWTPWFFNPLDRSPCLRRNLGLSDRGPR